MTTPYRDDLDALREQLSTLESELSDIERRRAELDAAVASEQALRDRVASLRRRIRTGVRRTLPLLESLRVASPCNADWDDMVGDDRMRFCGQCAKHVFDLSAMDRAEAEAFVRARTGQSEAACIRFWRRGDGTVLTADCPDGARRKRVRAVAGVALGAGLLAAGASMAATTVTMEEMRPIDAHSPQPAPTDGPRATMGEMSAPEPSAQPTAPLDPPRPHAIPKSAQTTAPRR